MKYYICITNEYCTYSGDYFGTGDPPESGSDIRIVKAETRDKAKVIFLKWLKDSGNKVLDEGYDNPFRNFTVKLFKEEESGPITEWEDCILNVD